MRLLILALGFVLLLGCAGTAPEKNDTGPVSPPAAEAAEMTFSQLSDGTTYALEAKEVSGDIGGQKIRMFAYNGQIPGPVLRVRQGSSVWINFTNSIGYNTTVHWHGIRLENRYDGVPDVTQDAVAPGESFLYKLDFPDEGMYWYHPHVREELQQELGLYGVIIVEPNETGYFGPVDREEILVLDDILMKGTEAYPFPEETTDFALMGRFGNVMLVNGKTDFRLNVKTGEKVRLYLLNAANVRPFNFSIEGTGIKVVAGDGSKFERSYLADSLVITPSERYIVETVFDEAGEYELRSDNPLESHVIGKVIVEGSDAAPASLSAGDDSLIAVEMEQYKGYYDAEPDLEYELTVDIEGGMMDGGMMGMMDHTEGGIEWEDTMPMMNRNSNSDRVKWIIRDKASGKENMDAVREVPKGKPLKIRIENLERSEHPMQHTIHIHGAQFLVLKTDGIRNDNLVWKDSVNMPIDSAIELLVEFPNEGEWMMHCHIAEHLSSGMMTSFEVK